MTDAPHMTLSEEELSTLTAARDVLDALAARALYGTPGTPSSQADGMIYVRATGAQDAIFKALNSVKNWWHCEMTDAQLHNRAPVDVES